MASFDRTQQRGSVSSRQSTASTNISVLSESSGVKLGGDKERDSSVLLEQQILSTEHLNSFEDSYIDEENKLN